MYRKSILLAAFVALITTGCQQPSTVEITETDRQESNRWLVREYAKQQAANAVMTQRTIYPYQFESGSAVLNDLGRRDILILAEKYNREPGQLNVRRGATDRALYRQRVDAVMQALTDAGVEADRIRITDETVGGEGAASDRVLMVYNRSNEVEQ